MSSERTPRRRVTRKSVLVTEKVARTVITVGGIGTTFAVVSICLFLVWVVLPIFGSTQAEETERRPVTAEEPLYLGVDEYRTLGIALERSGVLTSFRLSDGAPVGATRAWPESEGEATAWAFSNKGEDVAIGFEDGSVRLGGTSFELDFHDEDALPDGLVGMERDELRIFEGGLGQWTPSGQVRVQTAAVDLADPIDAGEGAGIVALDYSRSPSGVALCTLDAEGRLVLNKVRETRNMLTGKVTQKVTRVEMPPPAVSASGERGLAQRLLLSDLADQVFLIWSDGYAARYDLRDRDAGPQVAEVLDLVPTEGATVTAAEFLIGGTTLLVGDSSGESGAWFRVEDPTADTSDGARLQRAHVLTAPGGAAVTDFGPSPRSRSLSVGYADGAVRLFYVTSEELLVELPTTGSEPVLHTIVAPKEDGIVALTDSSFSSWDLDLAYPEASLDSLFGTIWYEGYEAPSPHVWQSTGGTDDFEPKLGLRVLIFGTIKGTLYSMLFGAPIAILAAIFSSEFLNRRLRSPVKSSIELMAGLPSVVLGFLAGAVFAPFVQGGLASVIVSFATVPFCFLLGAGLWSLLPKTVRLRCEGLPRLTAVTAALAFGVLLPIQLGPLVEDWLFGGDMEAWLDGRVGSALGGWVFLFLPLTAALFAFLGTTMLDRPLQRRLSEASDRAVALVRLAKFAVIAVLSVLGAFALGGVVSAAGMDARGGLVDTYIQRNALVVGFAMGFAIIPIIYTLTEDALSGVPAQLRQASLGAGATQWQTAIRIIIPTAGSGIFSAVMIGLGRAVGETMIVLMATGNTPVRDWNVFNGFRTLSANIAVELPEAAQGSGHYRTLFLAGLTLFAMTFVLNTLAERLRAQSRKRAFQL